MLSVLVAVISAFAVAEISKIFLSSRAKTSNTFLVAFIMFHLTIWALTGFARIWHGRKKKRLGVTLVQDMETYKQVCYAQSHENYRLRMLRSHNMTETDSLELSSIGDNNGNNLQEADHHAPIPPLNQLIPQPLGQSSNM